MTIISLIAAIDQVNGLGMNKQLCWHLPADLQHFKTQTVGKPIIMGRTTFESIGKPLPNRTNIVLSRSAFCIPGVTSYDSLGKAVEALKNTPEIMIIGGAQIYNESMAIAHRLYITHIHHQFEADVFFPPIEPTLWHCHSKTFRAHDEKNKYDMTFCVYERLRNAS